MARKTGEGPFKTGIMPTFISDQQFTLPAIKTSAHLVKYHKLHYAETDDSIRNIQLHFFIGTTNDSIIVIADANFNKDFTDDSILYYPSSKKILATLPYIEVNIPGSATTFSIQPYPYKTAFTYHAKEEQSLYLMVKGYEHFEGKHLPGIQLFVANLKPDISFTTEEDVLVAVKDASETALKKMGEFIRFNGHTYILSSIDKSFKKIILTQVNASDKPVGTTAGVWINPFNTNTITGNKITIPFPGKYVLLDFWGTWCGPCIELTPKLRMFAEQYKGKVALVSIAFDDEVKKVQAYVNANKMMWDHLVEGKEQMPVRLTRILRVTEFPTFVLIDSEGKILFRGSGEEGLEGVMEIFEGNQL